MKNYLSSTTAVFLCLNSEAQKNWFGKVALNNMKISCEKKIKKEEQNRNAKQKFEKKNIFFRLIKTINE